MQSIQSGGDNSININDIASLQSGGDASLYSSIDSDLMSVGTIDLFSNFVNKHKFKKQMQTGGGDIQKKENKNSIMSIEKAVKMLNDVYK